MFLIPKWCSSYWGASWIRTQTDRDILALEEAMAVDLHYIYHPVGLKYAVSTVNPNRTVLETVASWSKLMETKNIPIVRATVVSNKPFV